MQTERTKANASVMKEILHGGALCANIRVRALTQGGAGGEEKRERKIQPSPRGALLRRFSHHPLVHLCATSVILILHHPAYARQLKEADKPPLPPGIGKQNPDTPGVISFLHLHPGRLEFGIRTVDQVHRRPPATCANLRCRTGQRIPHAVKTGLKWRRHDPVMSGVGMSLLLRRVGALKDPELEACEGGSGNFCPCLLGRDSSKCACLLIPRDDSVAFGPG